MRLPSKPAALLLAAFLPLLVSMTPVAAQAEPQPTLLVRQARGGPVPLGEAVLSGDSTVSLEQVPAGVTRVSFHLDDRALRWSPQRVERVAPYTLPLDAAWLTAGPHTVSARLHARDGRVRVVHATFVASGTAAGQGGSAPRLVADGRALGGGDLDADVTVAIEPHHHVRRAEFHLDAPVDGGDPDVVEKLAPFTMRLDPAELAVGDHHLSVRVHLRDGRREVVQARFRTGGDAADPVEPGDGENDDVGDDGTGPGDAPGIDDPQVGEPDDPAPTSVRHITPTGAGDRSGTSRADAGRLSDLGRLVADSQPGGEVWIHGDLGPYRQRWAVPVAAGGRPGAPVVVRGTDADGTPLRPVIIGGRTSPYDPDGTPGSDLFRLLEGADHLRFQHLAVRDVGNGVVLIGGPVRDLAIEDVRATNVRRFLENLTADGNPRATASGVVVRGVTVEGYSKGAVRLRYDTHDVLLEDVLGDSQRQDGDRFAMGVALQEGVHDVTHRRVTMRNSHDTVTHRDHSDTPGDPRTYFWNGDGFAAESGVRDVRYERTVASGNTDAGYDLKAEEVVMADVASFDNQRNYRFWGTATVQGCTGGEPRTRGGTGLATQVHINDDARVLLSGCTFTATSPDMAVFHFEPTGAASLTVASSGVVRHADAPLSFVRPGDRGPCNAAAGRRPRRGGPVGAAERVRRTVVSLVSRSARSGY